jgi:hypothetical protein
MGFLMAARFTDCDLVFMLYIAILFETVVRAVSFPKMMVWFKLGIVCMVLGDYC